MLGTVESKETGKELIGHPRGLWILFGAEFWERFSYYGMRALLGPYVAVAFFSHRGGGAEAEASLTYGGYTAMVYMTGVLGGFSADRWLGYRRAVVVGGILMAAGILLLLIPSFPVFLAGLSVIVLGNGLFKPNVSTMVGELYSREDPRRDSGFTIFYMGINAGSSLAPIICAAWIGATYGLKWGFAAAALGMLAGLALFHARRNWLDGAGSPPSMSLAAGLGRTALVLLVLAAPVYFLLQQSDVLGVVLAISMLGLAILLIAYGRKSGSPVQLDRYKAMLAMFACNIVFWALFEQAGSSLNFFARDYVDVPFNFTVFQAANPVFILILGPAFAMLWPWLSRRNLNPSIPKKFALGLIGLAAGYGALAAVIALVPATANSVPWWSLVALYALHTMGELCLSPIGLSMVTKLSRPTDVGVAMGGWFLSIATGNFLAGRIAALTLEEAGGRLESYAQAYGNLALVGVIAAVVFFIIARPINRLMHGVN